MVVKVVMPQFYETMQTGKILRWLKKEGEKTEKGRPIVEVETEKVAVEIEAPQDGLLAKILAKEGDDIPILQTIAIIATPEEESLDIDSLIEEIGLTARVEEKIEKVEKPKERVFEELEKTVARAPISPVARKLAQEQGIDVAKIIGSGPGGRIVKEDVMKAIEEARTAIPPALEPMRAKLMPMSKMRKTIAERMSYSARTAPQVTITSEVDMSEVVKLREKLLPDFERTIGVHISYTDMLIKVVAMALRDEPIFNSRLEGDQIRLMEDINVGVAVEVEEGLIVPVVRNADKKTLVEITKSTKQLIERAKEGKLSSSEVSGGTFTITNLGSYGVETFTPLVNPPETAILGVGTIADKPVVIGGQITVRPVAFLSLSFDHRVIDGASAARFLQRLKQIIENPAPLLS